MIQEDKELLLKDLSARLPYGVIVRHADPLIDNNGNEIGEFWYKRGYLCDITTLDDITTTIIESEGSDEEGYEHICDLERSLPYLRPMSSMTEEESHEYNMHLLGITIGVDAINFMIWVYQHHLDILNLIDKGLALEAKEGMYNLKE